LGYDPIFPAPHPSSICGQRNHPRERCQGPRTRSNEQHFVAAGLHRRGACAVRLSGRDNPAGASAELLERWLVPLVDDPERSSGGCGESRAVRAPVRRSHVSCPPPHAGCPVVGNPRLLEQRDVEPAADPPEVGPSPPVSLDAVAGAMRAGRCHVPGENPQSGLGRHGQTADFRDSAASAPSPKPLAYANGRGWFRTTDLSRVKRDRAVSGRKPGRAEARIRLRCAGSILNGRRHSLPSVARVLGESWVGQTRPSGS
jgi:hypothetical protein